MNEQFNMYLEVTLIQYARTRTYTAPTVSLQHCSLEWNRRCWPGRGDYSRVTWQLPVNLPRTRSGLSDHWVNFLSWTHWIFKKNIVQTSYHLDHLNFLSTCTKYFEVYNGLSCIGKPSQERHRICGKCFKSTDLFTQTRWAFSVVIKSIIIRNERSRWML